MLPLRAQCEQNLTAHSHFPKEKMKVEHYSTCNHRKTGVNFVVLENRF